MSRSLSTVFAFLLFTATTSDVSGQCTFERTDGWMKVHAIDTGATVSAHGKAEHFAVVLFSFVGDSSRAATTLPLMARDTAEFVVCSNNGGVQECLVRMGIAEGSLRRMYHYRRVDGSNCASSFTVLDTLGWMFPGCRDCIGVPRSQLAEK